MTADEVNLRLSLPHVLEFRGAYEPGVEEHVHWKVGVAPEADEGGRVVFSTLHAFANAGGGEVTVGSTFYGPAAIVEDTEEFLAALDGSDALETLYDITRAALRPALALLPDQGPVLAVSAPKPDIDMLRRRAEPDDEYWESMGERMTSSLDTQEARMRAIQGFITGVIRGLRDGEDDEVTSDGDLRELESLSSAMREIIDRSAQEAG